MTPRPHCPNNFLVGSFSTQVTPLDSPRPQKAGKSTKFRKPGHERVAEDACCLRDARPCERCAYRGARTWRSVGFPERDLRESRLFIEHQNQAFNSSTLGRRAAVSSKVIIGARPAEPHCPACRQSEKSAEACRYKLRARSSAGSS